MSYSWFRLQEGERQWVLPPGKELSVLPYFLGHGRVTQGAMHWYLGLRRTPPYPPVALPPYLQVEVGESGEIP